MSAPRTAAEVQEWKCRCRHTFEEHSGTCRFFACHCPVSQAELVVELLREARVEEMRRISGVLLLAASASIMEDLS